MSNQKLSISKLVNIIKTVANDINGANGIFLILSLAIKNVILYNGFRTERWQSGNAADC